MALLKLISLIESWCFSIILDMFDDNMSFFAFTRLSANFSSSRFLFFLAFTHASSFSFFPSSMMTCPTVRQITNISQFCSLSPRIGARDNDRRRWSVNGSAEDDGKKRQQEESHVRFHGRFINDVPWSCCYSFKEFVSLPATTRPSFHRCWADHHKRMVIDRRYWWSNSQGSQTTIPEVTRGSWWAPPVRGTKRRVCRASTASSAGLPVSPKASHSRKGTCGTWKQKERNGS